MSLPCLTTNNIKIYNVTGYSYHKLPDWLVKQNTKRLKKDTEWGRRVQLIQDFEFPEASLQVAFTPDNHHIIATGVYKPQFRVYELADMTLKFERHTNAETTTMTILSEDWRKLALLQTDRYIEFHSPSGLYYSTRIPRVGRDMVYDPITCDLLVGASSNELYRLNLDRGQFMAPFETSATAINCVRISPLHGMYGMACDNGQVEFWDRRDRHCLGALQISKGAFSSAGDDPADLAITALHFLPDGLHWVAGTGDGRVLLFDLRSSLPLDVRDHYNGFAIKKIDYHMATGMVVSCDRRSVKFWNGIGNMQPSNPVDTVQAHGGGGTSSRLFTAIEPEADVNDFTLQQGTGLVLMANEASPVSSYFIPALGPAPRWCSFLENLTEEMEERSPQAAAVYDNFKFVTRTELGQLGLDHLIGTNLLRAYMHGFFLDLRLYEKAKAIANPFAYEEYLAKRKQEKLDKERQSRIRAPDPTRAVKVNKRLAAKLVERQRQHQVREGEALISTDQPISTPAETATNKRSIQKSHRSAEAAQSLLKDSRFADLFNDPDFEIDEQSSEYFSIHPTAKKS